MHAISTAGRWSEGSASLCKEVTHERQLSISHLALMQEHSIYMSTKEAQTTGDIMEAAIKSLLAVQAR
jgi:hypothetical protein